MPMPLPQPAQAAPETAAFELRVWAEGVLTDADGNLLDAEGRLVEHDENEDDQPEEAS